MTAAFLYLVPFCWAIDPQSLLIISADPRATHEPFRAISRCKPPSPQQPPPKRTPCILPTPSQPTLCPGAHGHDYTAHYSIGSYQNPLFLLFLLLLKKKAVLEKELSQAIVLIRVDLPSLNFPLSFTRNSNVQSLKDPPPSP